MPLDPLHGLHPSPQARCVFACLHQRGGSMRLGPLLRRLGRDRRVIVDALNELRERYWITVVWRKAAPGTADEDSRPLTDIYRLCTTPFGRRKYRSTWPLD
ncbi:MAG TPA: hypothetical protein VH913_00735 [Hyphomicrobiaceae bacterium]|jgi:hypothetical protein